MSCCSLQVSKMICLPRRLLCLCLPSLPRSLAGLLLSRLCFQGVRNAFRRRLLMYEGSSSVGHFAPYGLVGSVSWERRLSLRVQSLLRQMGWLRMYLWFCFLPVWPSLRCYSSRFQSLSVSRRWGLRVLGRLDCRPTTTLLLPAVRRT